MTGPDIWNQIIYRVYMTDCTRKEMYVTFVLKLFNRYCNGGYYRRRN